MVATLILSPPRMSLLPSFPQVMPLSSALTLRSRDTFLPHSVWPSLSFLSVEMSTLTALIGALTGFKLILLVNIGTLRINAEYAQKKDIFIMNDASTQAGSIKLLGRDEDISNFFKGGNVVYIVTSDNILQYNSQSINDTLTITAFHGSSGEYSNMTTTTDVTVEVVSQVANPLIVTHSSPIMGREDTPLDLWTHKSVAWKHVRGLNDRG